MIKKIMDDLIVLNYVIKIICFYREGELRIKGVLNKLENCIKVMKLELEWNRIAWDHWVNLEIAYASMLERDSDELNKEEQTTILNELNQLEEITKKTIHELNLKNVELLIDVLCDKNASEDERNDAASYLGSYDDNRALEALAAVGSDKEEDEIVLDSCGIALGEIMLKRNQFLPEIADGLAPIAKDAVFYTLKSSNLV